MLYQFDELDKKLDVWGFPTLKKNHGFQVIKNVDFGKAYEAGSISFENDGIYLEYNGIRYKGYMHLAKSYKTRYGNHPRFHLTQCKTIQEFITNDTFNKLYIWSNSNKADLIDDMTGEEYKDLTLNLCNNCRHHLFDSNLPNNTQSFYDLLDKSEIKQKNIKVDIFGYEKNWQKISKDFRESKKYVCEKCGIKPLNNLDKRFWHTHHKNGDKTNNSPSNLECLCMLCHSFEDDNHENNFSKEKMRKGLVNFLNKYQDGLTENKNPYLKIIKTDI